MVRNMKLKERGWIDVNEQLPPEDKYVLVHLNYNNWPDKADPEGVYFKVCKLQMCNGMYKKPNNKRDFEWYDSGHFHFGQDVDFWMNIP